MKIRSYSLLVSALAFSFTALAGAQTAYSSFGPGQAFDVGNGWTVNGSTSSSQPPTQTVACGFTSSATGSLSNVMVAVALVNGTDGVDVTLFSDNSGAIGSELETWSLTSLPSFGSNFTPEVLTSTPGVSLTSGSDYWLEISPAATDTWAVWDDSPSASGNLGFSNDGGSTFTYGPDVDGAFSVQVTPEPSSFLGLGLGILPLFLIRRKRSV